MNDDRAVAIEHVGELMAKLAVKGPTRSELRLQKDIERSRLFLVLGLGYSLNQPDRITLAGLKRKPPKTVSTIPTLEAKIKPVLLLKTEDKKEFPNNLWNVTGRGRLSIVLGDSSGADQRARSIADALRCLLAAFHGLRPPQDFDTYRIPEKLLKRGEISWERLEKVESSRGDFYFEIDFRARLESLLIVPESSMAYVFFYLPKLVASQELLDAAHFYLKCKSEYEFVGDAITEILAEPDACPSSGDDRVSLENLVLNAFRAIEALVGEPGQNDTRFRNRLLARGIEPDELLGFRGTTKRKLHDRIRWLHDLRDQTSAHGKRRRSRPVSLMEAMEAQHVAKTVLLKALFDHASKQGRHEGDDEERLYLLRKMFGRDLLRSTHVRQLGQEPSQLVMKPGGLRQLVEAVDSARRSAIATS